MNKFKVGDIIKGNEKSNDRYFLYNKKSGWIGEVIEVYDDDRIGVKTVPPEGVKYKVNYPLYSEYFDLAFDGTEALNDLLDWLDGNTVRNPKQAVEQYMREKGYIINKEK